MMTDKKGMGFSGQCCGYDKSLIVFVRALDGKDPSEEKATFSGVNSFHGITTLRPSRRWICHFCGKSGEIIPEVGCLILLMVELELNFLYG